MIPLLCSTLTGLQWGIYDAYKVYVGLPTTGSAPPPTVDDAAEVRGVCDIASGGTTKLCRFCSHACL